MKLLLTITAIVSFSIACSSQQMTLTEWNEQAKSNIRLSPKYGHAKKTEEQKSIDKDFVEATLKTYPVIRKASDHLIELGFKYLYKDVKTAMYRFNQAYLLDSSNIDIYWGYAAVYMVLGDYQKAKLQYNDGLLIEPANTHLLTDYGTYFMAQYYQLQPINEKNALVQLDSALYYLTKSYRINSKDPNTTFKLSACYYQKKDCKNAWRYYDECAALGGQPISEDFTNALKAACKK